MSRKKIKTGKESGSNEDQTAKASLSSTMWYALLFTFVSFLVDQSNLFGFGDVIEAQNERIYQRLTAGFYGSDPEHAQDKLAVMLYTDRLAELKALGWPMKMAEFGWLMTEIRDANAQGLFIDVVFRSVEHDRQGFCEFYRDISDITSLKPPQSSNFDDCLDLTRQLVAAIEDHDEDNSGVPVVWLTQDKKFAQIDKNSSSDPPAIPVIVGASLDYLNARSEYFDCTGAKSCTSDQLKKFQNAILAWPVTALLDHVAILAPVSIGAENDRAMHLLVDDKYLSPAWLIARQMAVNLAVNSAGEKKDKVEAEYAFLKRSPPYTVNAPGELSLLTKNLYLKWGSAIPEKQNEALPLAYFDGCAQRGQNKAHMLRLIAAQAFPGSSAAKDLIARCPYHLTIDMYDYYNGVFTEDDTSDEVRERFDFGLLKDLLNGRFVLVGLAMGRFSDYTESPVNGRIAGVYTHAMATDNLLEYKQKIFTTDSQTKWWLTAFQYLLTAALAFSMLNWFDWIKQKVKHKPNNKRWTFVGVLIVTFVLSLLVWGVFTGLPEWAQFREDIPWLDLALILMLLFSIAYFWFIYQGKRLKRAPKKWISERRVGLCQCMPHVAIMSIAFLLLIMVGVGVSYLNRDDPFNTLYTFLSLLGLYFVGARNETIGGIATFIMNEDLAEEFFG